MSSDIPAPGRRWTDRATSLTARSAGRGAGGLSIPPRSLANPGFRFPAFDAWLQHAWSWTPPGHEKRRTRTGAALDGLGEEKVAALRPAARIQCRAVCNGMFPPPNRRTRIPTRHAKASTTDRTALDPVSDSRPKWRPANRINRMMLSWLAIR